MVIKEFLNAGEREFNYIISHPENTRDLPLMIYLHGAGERGKNIDHLYRHAVPMLIKEGREIEAVVLCPQCPAKYVWNNVVVELKALIDAVVEEYQIKPDRIVITGSSMGGFGTWEMGLTYRNFFAAIAPVAGGGAAWRCRSLKTTPVIAYHGKNDQVVTLDNSIQMVGHVKESGGNAELNLLDVPGHSDSINYTYRETDIIQRLLSFRRTDFTYVPDVCEEMF